MIVDDDSLSRIIYDKILTSKGYMVCTCDTAVGIFKTISEQSPDLILMDHQMPVVSGVEAIKQMKNSELYKSIPVILFSSVHNIKMLAEEAGADAYMSKSSSHEQFYALVQDTINLYYKTNKGLK